MSTRRNLRGIISSGVWVAVAGAGMHAQLANAHGYASEPPSRAYACKLGLKPAVVSRCMSRTLWARQRKAFRHRALRTASSPVVECGPISHR